MTKILIIFTILTFINVVFSTIKSIVTIKGGWLSSSLISGLYYGYYNIVLLYTVADFPLWQKVAVTALMNIIGVAIVKIAEEKSRKDKLWKVEMTIPNTRKEMVTSFLAKRNIPYNYIEGIGKYIIINCYCETQKQSQDVKTILEQIGGKFFVSESKTL